VRRAASPPHVAIMRAARAGRRCGGARVTAAVALGVALLACCVMAARWMSHVHVHTRLDVAASSAPLPLGARPAAPQSQSQ
jgi:hypothetical protein